MRYKMRKPLRMMATIVIAACCGIAASCGHDTPGVEPETNGGQIGTGTDVEPGHGHRPGIGETDNTDRELKDDVLRIKGPDMNMRYDRGGILFITGRDGSVRIIDIDGADEVCVSPGIEGADSVMTGGALTVSGRKIALSTMKKMRHTEGRIWYMAADTAGDNWVMVLPQ